ncbi:MAG: hypothetical protein ACFKPT_08505 [Gloeotrichia echinulata GP01]
MGIPTSLKPRAENSPIGYADSNFRSVRLPFSTGRTHLAWFSAGVRVLFCTMREPKNSFADSGVRGLRRVAIEESRRGAVHLQKNRSPSTLLNRTD